MKVYKYSQPGACGIESQLLGGGFKYFGDDESNLTCAYFSDGLGKNHQPARFFGRSLEVGSSFCVDDLVGPNDDLDGPSDIFGRFINKDRHHES